MLRDLIVIAALLGSVGTATAEFFQYSPTVNVAYDVQGHGATPVVLVHGLAASKEAWDLFLPYFLPDCNCRVYRVDLKGHGDTSAPDDHQYSVGENARLVMAFMKEQGLRDAILIGHSYGGAVTLHLALDAAENDPGLLRALVLMSTPGVQQRFPFIVAHQRYEAYGKVVDRLTPSKMRAFIVVHGANPRFTKGTKMRVKLYSRLWSDRPRSRASRETAREFLDHGGLKELSSRNHDTRIPTLVIAGTRDHLVRLKRARQLAASIPTSKLVVVKAGHAFQEDAPQLIAPPVLDFMRGLPKEGR